MNAIFIKFGTHVVNLPAVASAHWERERLFVHLDGGRFLQLDGQDAARLWSALCDAVAVDLDTGEVRSDVTPARSAAAGPEAASTAAEGTSRS